MKKKRKEIQFSKHFAKKERRRRGREADTHDPNDVGTGTFQRRPLLFLFRLSFETGSHYLGSFINVPSAGTTGIQLARWQHFLTGPVKDMLQFETRWGS